RRKVAALSLYQTNNILYSTFVFNTFLFSERRTGLVKELLKTEETYLESLRTLTTDYIEPMKEMTKEENAELTNDHIKKIFGNVDVIIRFNTTLCERLKIRVNDWFGGQKIGDEFTKLVSFF